MVVDLFNGGKERCQQAKLWELWRDFWGPYEHLVDRNVHLTVKKVKADCDDVDIVPKEHRAGSNFADHYNGRAAIDITTGHGSRVRRLDRKTRLMQERMIQALLPKEG